MWPGLWRVGQLHIHDREPRPSLKRIGLHYNIFYSHRFDPETPLEETMGALTPRAPGQGALCRHFLLQFAPHEERCGDSRRLGTPCLIHQPSYSMLNRWIEVDGLLDALEAEGYGTIVFSPLAQGLLTDKYLNGVPDDSRAKLSHFFNPKFLSPETSRASAPSTTSPSGAASRWRKWRSHGRCATSASRRR